MPTKTTAEGLARESHRLKELTVALAQLQAMGLTALRVEHLRLLGFEARSKNLTYLRRRLAWRLQELVEGGLSDLAQTRLQALIPEDLPVRKPRGLLEARPKSRAAPAPLRDPRLPAEGTVIERTFRGGVHTVEIQAQTFLYEGRNYPSLSTVAKAITGTSWNGYLFFGLVTRGA